jgi:hypothetical protein
MTIPTYLFYLIAAGTVVVITTILYGLSRLPTRIGQPRIARERLV